MPETAKQSWTTIIRPKSRFFSLNLKEVWDYKDLIILFVRRDFVAVYKQTILGPLWFVLQPLITSFTFFVIFGKIANIQTDGVPHILFYLSGLVYWTYFAECLNKSSTTFRDNAAIFGKVYFPRLVIPISLVISNMLKFGIQFVIFLAFWIYFLSDGNTIQPNIYILLMPVCLLITAALGMGFGILISSMTTKYRDFTFLITFGIQLWMYATPIIYPLSTFPEKYRWIMALNPMTGVVETSRYGFLGSGTFEPLYLLISAAFALVILLIGTLTFNKVERTFMDTV